MDEDRQHLTGNALGIKICEVLGIPPDLVQGLTIDVRPTEPVRIFIDAVVRGDTGRGEWLKIAQALEDAELVIELYDAEAGEQIDSGGNVIEPDDEDEPVANYYPPLDNGPDSVTARST